MGDQAFVHGPREHHLGNLHAGVIGDAQPLDVARFQAQPALQGSDLGAAAVDEGYRRAGAQGAQPSDQALQERPLGQLGPSDLDDA